MLCGLKEISNQKGKIDEIVNIIDIKSKQMSSDKDFQAFRRWLIEGNIPFDGHKPKCKFIGFFFYFFK